MRHKITFLTQDDSEKQKTAMSFINIIKSVADSNKMDYLLDRSDGKTRTRYVFEYKLGSHEQKEHLAKLDIISACEQYFVSSGVGKLNRKGNEQ